MMIPKVHDATAMLTVNSAQKLDMTRCHVESTIHTNHEAHGLKTMIRSPQLKLRPHPRAIKISRLRVIDPQRGIPAWVNIETVLLARLAT